MEARSVRSDLDRERRRVEEIGGQLADCRALLLKVVPPTLPVPGVREWTPHTVDQDADRCRQIRPPAFPELPGVVEEPDDSERIPPANVPVPKRVERKVD